MNLKNPKNWIKEITLAIMLIIECVVTYCGFTNNWELEVRFALIFASILTLFNEILSVLNKFDKHVDELREESKNEHKEIKGGLELYKDIVRSRFVTDFEGAYVAQQKKQSECNIEIWIISNSVAEPDAVIDEISKNIRDGAHYYYIIPNNSQDIKDLENTVSKLKNKNKKLPENSFQYIVDDLFDLMPTKLVSILFYCNTLATDYSKEKMKVFYSFQKTEDDFDKVFYNPAKVDEGDIKMYSQKMEEWKKRKWEVMI